MIGRTLVLIGSPKGLEGSNSARYAHALSREPEEQGGALDWVHLHRAVVDQPSVDDLLAKVDAADLILLVAPLYVDSLPAPVIGAFERIAEARSRLTGEAKIPGFAALIHCGFIEPVHNRTAVDVCREFADAAGFSWFGGLTFGGGGIPARRIRRVLEQASDALANGSPIPSVLCQRAERPIMPRWLYILGGNAMWRRVARKQGVTKAGLRARPYADDA